MGRRANLPGWAMTWGLGMAIGRIGWALAPLTTGALALALLGAGPGVASDTDARAAATPTSQGSWGAPIRLMNSLSGVGNRVGETWNGVGVAMDGRGNGVAFSALDYVPGVDEQGRLAPLPSEGNFVNSSANLVMRYVDGAWQEPEVIEAPMSLSGYVSIEHSPTVSVSEDGYAAIVAMGEISIRSEWGLDRRSGIFMSTSHDITKPGSFTPWTEILTEPHYRALALHYRVPLAVGRGGNVITGYTVHRPQSSGEDPCRGSSFARAGLIREGGVSLNPPREVAQCHIYIGWLDLSPIDVAISGSTATVAYQEGEPGCVEVRGRPEHCSQVDLQTLNMETGAWSAPQRALPRAALYVDTGVAEYNFNYEHVRVATSSGGTAVVARLYRAPGVWQGYYINIPAGTTPDVSTAVRLRYQESSEASTTAYFLSDVVISSDGTALAAYDVETCKVWIYLSCAGTYKRSFQVLEFTPTRSTMHELTPAVTTNWSSRYTNRIAMSLPPSAPLSRVVIAYTRSGSLVDDVQQASWIETRAWPLTEVTRNIVPAPQGFGTTPDAWHWTSPAVAASATGAGLVLYRPHNNASDFVGQAATQEVWASGLNTANRGGLSAPLYVKASAGADKRVTVTGIRPFFYPEGGGEEAFFNRGAQPRAKMEVLVATGPTGYRVTNTPVCTTGFNSDSSASDRSSSTRGSASCTIAAALPTGKYTFVARTSLDGQTSTLSSPTAPITYTAPAAQQTVTLTQLKAIGKGASVRFQIKGTATGFTTGSALTVWVKAGTNTSFTQIAGATVKLGKPDRQGKQAFTYTSKTKYPKPISIYVTSQDQKVRSGTRTIS